jgi:hypothetical protein
MPADENHVDSKHHQHKHPLSAADGAQIHPVIHAKMLLFTELDKLKKNTQTPAMSTGAIQLWRTRLSRWAGLPML